MLKHYFFFLASVKPWMSPQIVSGIVAVKQSISNKIPRPIQVVAMMSESQLVEALSARPIKKPRVSEMSPVLNKIPTRRWILSKDSSGFFVCLRGADSGVL